MTPQPQHCEHECVCRWYVDEEYCMHPDIPDCIPLPCPYDTRTSRPAPSPKKTPQEIRGFVMIDRQKDFVLWLKQHDAAIAAQARDKALDDAISAVESVNINDVEDARNAIEFLRSGGNRK